MRSGGAGAGQQFLLVVPSLDLIVVRNGEQLDPALAFEEGLDRFVVAPLVRAIWIDPQGPISPQPSDPGGSLGSHGVRSSARQGQ